MSACEAATGLDTCTSQAAVLACGLNSAKRVHGASEVLAKDPERDKPSLRLLGSAGRNAVAALAEACPPPHGVVSPHVPPLQRPMDSPSTRAAMGTAHGGGYARGAGGGSGRRTGAGSRTRLDRSLMAVRWGASSRRRPEGTLRPRRPRGGGPSLSRGRGGAATAHRAVRGSPRGEGSRPGVAARQEPSAEGLRECLGAGGNAPNPAHTTHPYSRSLYSSSVLFIVLPPFRMAFWF